MFCNIVTIIMLQIIIKHLRWDIDVCYLGVRQKIGKRRGPFVKSLSQTAMSEKYLTSFTLSMQIQHNTKQIINSSQKNPRNYYTSSYSLAYFANCLYKPRTSDIISFFLKNKNWFKRLDGQQITIQIWPTLWYMVF